MTWGQQAYQVIQKKLNKIYNLLASANQKKKSWNVSNMMVIYCLLCVENFIRIGWVILSLCSSIWTLLYDGFPGSRSNYMLEDASVIFPQSRGYILAHCCSNTQPILLKLKTIKQGRCIISFMRFDNGRFWSNEMTWFQILLSFFLITWYI